MTELTSKKLSIDEALVVIDVYIGRDWGDILDAARVLAVEVKRLRAEVRNHERELRDAARDAAAEREWMHRQGEDYGTY